jgi:hypothetical protein
MVNPNVATMALSVSCNFVGSCIAPVGVNGAGTEVLYTRDGGKSFTTVPTVFEMMFLGSAQCGDNAVLASPMLLSYNNAAQNRSYNFVNANVSSKIFMSQDVQCNDERTFFAVGQPIQTNQSIVIGGVAVSHDGGANFQYVPSTTLMTQARYGAFPTNRIWYVSAGNWPSSAAERAEDQHLLATSGVQTIRRSQRLSTVQHGSSIKHVVEFEPKQGDDPYVAQIVKTTDGGATWKSVFFQNNSFYFNQIACNDERNCVAVGEAGKDSPTPGARVWTTSDGGESWENTYYSADPHNSLMAAFAVGGSEYWVGGGELSQTNFTGTAYHSTDNGRTWQIQQIPDVYFDDINCVGTWDTSIWCAAVALTRQGSSAFLSHSS